MSEVEHTRYEHMTRVSEHCYSTRSTDGEKKIDSFGEDVRIGRYPEYTEDVCQKAPEEDENGKTMQQMRHMEADWHGGNT